MSLNSLTLFRLLVLLVTVFGADIAMARTLKDLRKLNAIRSGDLNSTVPLVRSEEVDQRQLIQDKLVQLGERHADMTHVPYIWGGERIGSKDDCNECRKCAASSMARLDKRLFRCTACRKCGIDCSHFVHKLYQSVGLTYNYASTRELSKITENQLTQHYRMVNIGKDLSAAQPGDLLLYPKHVAMLLRVRSDSNADFIHASRFRPGDRYKLGGLRLDMNQNVYRFRGQLVRILRHEMLVDDRGSMAQSAPASFSTPFSRVMDEWFHRS